MGGGEMMARTSCLLTYLLAKTLQDGVLCSFHDSTCETCVAFLNGDSIQWDQRNGSLSAVKHGQACPFILVRLPASLARVMIVNIIGIVTINTSVFTNLATIVFYHGVCNCTMGETHILCCSSNIYPAW